MDEEDRLRAVDLKPEAQEDKPEVAVYTYDASGKRTIKYTLGLDWFAKKLVSIFGAKKKAVMNKCIKMLIQYIQAHLL